MAGRLHATVWNDFRRFSHTETHLEGFSALVRESDLVARPRVVAAQPGANEELISPNWLTSFPPLNSLLRLSKSEEPTPCGDPRSERLLSTVIVPQEISNFAACFEGKRW